MKVKIEDLGGKYYGTEISFYHELKKKHPWSEDIDNSFTIWANADFEPSQRQLDYYEMTLKEWKDDQMSSDGHFESKFTDQLAKHILKALKTFEYKQ